MMSSPKSRMMKHMKKRTRASPSGDRSGMVSTAVTVTGACSASMSPPEVIGWVISVD